MLAYDEISEMVVGGIRFAILKERQGRRLTHSSGLQVVETANDLRAYKAELVENIANAERELTEFNDMDGIIDIVRIVSE